MSRTNGAGATLTTSYRPAETQSLATSSDGPTLLAAVYTHLNGPRDAGYTTNFLLNRWGSPDEVVNALGYRTRALRENALFPALTTTSIAANGFTTRAYHNARSLVDSTEAFDPYAIGCVDRTCNAMTRFVWHPVWNHVQSVTGPTGEVTRTFYGTARALPDSVQIGTTVARKTRVHYTAAAQVDSVREPGGGLSSGRGYDALGNLTTTRTALGFVTTHHRDALGRDTLVVTPTDAAQTAGLKRRDRTIYTVMDRVDSTMAIGAAVSYTLRSTMADTARIRADTLLTRHRYDSAGRAGVTCGANDRADMPPAEDTV